MDDFGAALILVVTLVVCGFVGSLVEGHTIKSECNNFGYMTIGLSRFECKLAPLEQKP